MRCHVMDKMRSTELGKMIKQQRVAADMTLWELADKTGVSASHLGRIERGERFPSGTVVRLVAEPFGENDAKGLFSFREWCA